MLIDNENVIIVYYYNFNDRWGLWILSDLSLFSQEVNFLGTLLKCIKSVFDTDNVEQNPFNRKNKAVDLLKISN